MSDDEKKAIKKRQKAYLKTKEWEWVKEQVLKRDNYMCRFTHKTKEDGAILTVHHTCYKHYGEHNQAEVDDCITVEKYTHLALHKVAGNRRWFSIEHPRNIQE